jgi:hypothetical protein
MKKKFKPSHSHKQSPASTPISGRKDSVIADYWAPKSVQTLSAPFKLTTRDYEFLKANAVSDATIKARGYFSIPNNGKGRKWIKENGFRIGKHGLGNYLASPVRDRAGNVLEHIIISYKTSPSNVKGAELRYLHQEESQEHFDYPPATRHLLAVGSLPIVWTSGVINADSAASQGLPVINLIDLSAVGVPLEFEILVDQLVHEEIAMKYSAGPEVLPRRHFLCLDSDWRESGWVQHTLGECVRYMRAHGGVPASIKLEPAEEGGAVRLSDLCRFQNVFEVSETVGAEQDAMARRATVRNDRLSTRLYDLDTRPRRSARGSSAEMLTIETNERSTEEILSSLRRAIAINGTNTIFRFGERLYFNAVNVSCDQMETISKGGSVSIEAIPYQVVTPSYLQQLACDWAKWIYTDSDGIHDTVPPIEVCEAFLSNPNLWSDVSYFEGDEDLFGECHLEFKPLTAGSSEYYE